MRVAIEVYHLPEEIKMVRKSLSLRRAKPRFKPQPTILVICEDAKSGRNYLEDARLHFRVQVHVDVTHCGKTDPKSIVTEALSRQTAFEQVYCVIDRDTHANFDDALKLAKTSKKVFIIDSHPCFEYWLLLHFGFTRKPYMPAGKSSAADLLIQDLQTCAGMDAYSKGATRIFGTLLGAPFNAARTHAPRALEDAIKTGEMNPSTRLHTLLDLFESLSEPSPIPA